MHVRYLIGAHVDSAWWLGANDSETEGDWRWNDGSVVFAEGAYLGFSEGEPNDFE